ncbi:uncharacterized protein LOC113227414 isoform X3 [Hyposmocoma kahamanoa]|uniref:uncharacterized protein LOC113227414 isoform X3 n=1 Tax=Hyposmocoma kahamanoa TaxID=1477025 RepID=UPI000E6DA50B|nr:uncharacterized protein LOC113227414 isoform X3 [Hyposmocoma kahamanoa]
MDNKGEDSNGEDSKKKGTKVKTEKKEKEKPLHIQDDPGPSRINLPGSLQSPKVHRPCISKSEHSITKIITRQDVANAIKLTSLSFGNHIPSSDRNVNLKEIKIPILEKCDNVKKIDTATIVDLKKFMTSCFKINKDVSIAPVSEVDMNVHSALNTIISDVPNTSCVTNNAQTNDSDINKKHNEVIITNPILSTIAVPAPILDPILSKIGADKESKKKNSGNNSEKSDLALTQRDSLSSIGSNVCRICMTRGRERLISPCNCKGSLANVHLSCLERWLNQVGRNHCELCGFSYPAIRTPRYTVLQALRLWFGNPRNRSHLQSDCLIFWLLSTVTAGLLAVCIVGTQYFVIEGNKFGVFSGISHRITETAMDFFMAIVLCGYSVTVYLLWKDHYVMWNRWRRANVNVRLLLTPDSNPVPFVPRTRYNNV